MSNTSIMAMVVDRANIGKARLMAQGIEEPTDGNGWTQGLNIFEVVDNHQYLFMFADGVSRCIHAEPEMLSVQHLENLYAAVSRTSATLEGQAMWVLLVDKKVEAEIREILAKTTRAAA
jgi:hypothetical protein